MTDLELWMSKNKPNGNGRYKRFEAEVLELLVANNSAKEIKEFLDSQHIAPVSINTVRRYIRELKQKYKIDSIRVNDEVC